MDERIELVVPDETRRTGGISLAVAVSLVLHLSLVVLFILGYKPSAPHADNVPIARYVELIKQNPQQFTEAPGPEVERAPLNAPLSDMNRKASTPNPTGDQPTNRPGENRGLYTPPMNPGPRAPEQRAVAPQQQQMTAGNPAPESAQPQTPQDDRLVYREPTKAAAANGGVDWKSAIREVGKVASLGGSGLDFGQVGGGEQGFAEQGPISFETQWYDWGPYAQAMVSKIRVNWYANMPQIIRTGIQGQLTIRFTIQRDGRITDVTLLKSSGVPPYDYAAKKAIELSSPLNPLPKDFPNPNERVTAMFFYNMELPK